MAGSAVADAPTSTSDPVQFLELSADSQSDGQPMELESLCMNCHENGKTTMLLAKIPHFREVVLCSFECEHCGLRNNEVQFAGTFGEEGVRLELTVPEGDLKALSRQVVKSDSAMVSIPELELEIPAATQKGVVTTVEGLLSNVAENLRLLQEERRQVDPATAEALDGFLVKLDACIAGQQAFTLVLDDPAGNSYLESVGHKPEDDPQLRTTHYHRTREQQVAVGLLPEAEEEQAGDAAQAGPGSEISAADPHHGPRPVGATGAAAAVARAKGAVAAELMAKYTAPEEVMVLPGRCFACGADTPTRMFQTYIPYFKEIILMANACDTCGYRNSEVKPGGATSERGRVITLKVQEEEDLRRDVIKSESASVHVPELELELTTGTMGGLVTTVEGLLDNIGQELKRTQSFHLGDSAQQVTRSHWAAFFADLDDCQALRRPWTLVLTDPLSNSFVAPLGEGGIEEDPRLEAHDYERDAEEEAHFGIDHLKLEDAQDAQRAEQAGAGAGGDARPLDSKHAEQAGASANGDKAAQLQQGTEQEDTGAAQKQEAGSKAAAS